MLIFSDIDTFQIMIITLSLRMRITGVVVQDLYGPPATKSNLLSRKSNFISLFFFYV